MANVVNNALFSSKRLAINVVTYKEGHRVLEHNDPMGRGRYYKFNVVLKKPERGGVFRAEKLSSTYLIAFTFFALISIYIP